MIQYEFSGMLNELALNGINNLLKLVPVTGLCMRRKTHKNCEHSHYCRFKYVVCQWPVARQAHQPSVEPAHEPHDVGSAGWYVCGLFIGHHRPQRCYVNDASPGHKATLQLWLKQPTRLENLKGLLSVVQAIDALWLSTISTSPSLASASQTCARLMDNSSPSRSTTSFVPVGN